MHQARLAVILALEEVVELTGGTSDLKRQVGELGAPDLFELRNAALYVGMLEGDVWSPGELRDSEKLQALTRALRKAVVSFAIIIDGSLTKDSADS